MVATGRVLKFDDVKGYGFISPDGGGEDVFVHANDLQFEKSRIRTGRRVTFQVGDGERGPKAFEVALLEDDEPNRVPTDDGLCDVLSVFELKRELTEAFIEAVPTMSGAQIAQARSRLVDWAREHNWVETR